MSLRFLLFILILIAIPAFGVAIMSKPIAMHFAQQVHPSQKWGPDDADVKIVHFIDYQNPASRRIYNQLVQVKGQDPDIQIISRELPNSERSEELAKMLLALRDFDLYQTGQNRFMYVPVDALNNNNNALALMGTLDIDTKKYELTRGSSKLDHQILWNKALAFLFGVPNPPLLVINGRVIDHDGFDASDIRSIINSNKK